MVNSLAAIAELASGFGDGAATTSDAGIVFTAIGVVLVAYGVMRRVARWVMRIHVLVIGAGLVMLLAPYVAEGISDSSAPNHSRSVQVDPSEGH